MIKIALVEYLVVQETRLKKRVKRVENLRVSKAVKRNKERAVEKETEIARGNKAMDESAVHCLHYLHCLQYLLMREKRAVKRGRIQKCGWWWWWKSDEEENHSESETNRVALKVDEAA